MNSLVVAFVIPKGGTCKTTSLDCLATALQKSGKKVLVVDMDPQANLTQAMGVRMLNDKKLVEAFENALEKEVPDINEMIVTDRNIPILPGSYALSAIDYNLVGAWKGEESLKRLIAPIKSEYDFIFIDCPSAWNQLTINAVVASDYILVPLQAESLPENGIESLEYHMRDFIKNNPEIEMKAEILGFVFTKFDDRKKIHKEISESLTIKYKDKVFSTRIRSNIQLANAQRAALDIFSYDPRSHGAQDYQHLAIEFLERIERLQNKEVSPPVGA